MSTRILDPNSINKKKEDEAIAPSQPLSTPQGGAAAPLNANQSQQPQQAPSSGTFTDISKYKQAAQNAGNRIAQGVQSNFSRQSRQADASLKDTTNQFKRSMDSSSGYAASEEGRAGAIGNVSNFAAKESGFNQPQMPQRGLAPSQQPQQPQSPQPEFTEKDFTDVINKEYSGIRRADQVDAYQQAQARAQAIRNYSNLVNNQNKNSDLMKATFGQNNNYTDSMNKLDSYLYGKSGAASAIKSSDQFKNAQGFDQRLDQTSTDLANQASTRAQQISQMRDDARKAFTDVATGRTQQVDQRLNSVENNWDNLTNMLKSNFIDPKTGETIKGSVELDPLTARMLQIRGGSQLFNLVKDPDTLDKFIKSRQFERDRLVSKQEQSNLARLEALSRLAKTPGMEYNNKYFDAGRAGTLSARDSVDQENIKRNLQNAMLGFQENALKNQTGTGIDYSHYKTNRGFNFGVNVPIVSHGSQTGNLATSLDKAGYNYEVPTYDKNFTGNDYTYEDFKNNLPDPNAGSGFEVFDPNYMLNSLQNIGQDILNDFTSRPVDAISSMVLGSEWNESKRKRESQARADVVAAGDLVNKLKGQLQTEGFYNNAMVADPTKNEEAKRKYEALKSMLASLDSTNVGNY